MNSYIILALLIGGLSFVIYKVIRAKKIKTERLHQEPTYDEQEEHRIEESYRNDT